MFFLASAHIDLIYRPLLLYLFYILYNRMELMTGIQREHVKMRIYIRHLRKSLFERIILNRDCPILL